MVNFLLFSGSCLNLFTFCWFIWFYLFSLEERQRADRRIREAKGDEFKPKWFNLTNEICPTPWGDLEVYEFNSKYHEHRAAIDSSDQVEEADAKTTEFKPWQYEDSVVSA